MGVVAGISKAIKGTDRENIPATIKHYGGRFFSDWEGLKMTHLITTMGHYQKERDIYECAQLAGIRVVLRAWWQDSVNIRNRLPEEPYEFPDPLVLSGNQLGTAPVAGPLDSGSSNAGISQAA